MCVVPRKRTRCHAASVQASQAARTLSSSRERCTAGNLSRSVSYLLRGRVQDRDKNVFNVDAKRAAGAVQALQRVRTGRAAPAPPSGGPAALQAHPGSGSPPCRQDASSGSAGRPMHAGKARQVAHCTGRSEAREGRTRTAFRHPHELLRCSRRARVQPVAWARRAAALAQLGLRDELHAR